MGLIEQAQEVYAENFPPETFFGRCVFLSWYCKRGTCKFCFRSTISHKIKYAEAARRSLASVLTDAIIGKNLGWPIEFLTGGYGILDFNEIVEIAKQISEIYGCKIWVNLGALKEEEMLQLQSWVDGICASIETVNPKLHKKICPDKEIEPYEQMLKMAGKLGLKKSITVVIGLGETKEDFVLLEKFIQKHKLDQITFYALKPVRGTEFTESPESEYYAWWIAKTRIAFPKIKIMAGLTPKKIDYIELILKAGANSITKFSALRKFNSPEAEEVERQVKLAGREFKGSLTKLPNVDWNAEVDRLSVGIAVKEKIKFKLNQYLEKMS